MSKNTRFTLFISLCVFGLIILFRGLYISFENITWLTTGVKTEGKLHEIEEKWGTDTEDNEILYYYGVYSYTSNQGSSHHVKNNTGFGDENSVSKTMTIYYDPKSPSNSLVAEPLYLYLLPIILIIIGIGLTYLGYFIRKPSTRKTRK